VPTKIPRARFIKATESLKINIGVLQNRDLTTTCGNREHVQATVITKITQARFRNASELLQTIPRQCETEKRAEIEKETAPRSLHKYPEFNSETLPDSLNRSPVTANRSGLEPRENQK